MGGYNSWLLLLEWGGGRGGRGGSKANNNTLSPYRDIPRPPLPLPPPPRSADGGFQRRCQPCSCCGWQHDCWCDGVVVVVMGVVVVVMVV